MGSRARNRIATRPLASILAKNLYALAVARRVLLFHQPQRQMMMSNLEIRRPELRSSSIGLIKEAEELLERHDGTGDRRATRKFRATKQRSSDQ